MASSHIASSSAAASFKKDSFEACEGGEKSKDISTMDDFKNLKEFHISDADVMGDLKALMGEIQREEQGDRPPSYDSLQDKSPPPSMDVDSTSDEEFGGEGEEIGHIKTKSIGIEKEGRNG